VTVNVRLYSGTVIARSATTKQSSPQHNYR